ncbi:hypothetical protein [Halobacillus ihumii]|uniref:hypothetical protein n=1 Tax=Halobacillus ihumii TaxID=2686092 RepID=UPI0013D00AD0|nr:hypothetical protein [Halobacillus ihumii]
MIKFTKKKIMAGTLAIGIFATGGAAGATTIYTISNMTDQVYNAADTASTVNSNLTGATQEKVNLKAILEDKNATIEDVVSKANGIIAGKNRAIESLDAEVVDLNTQITSLQDQLDQAKAGQVSQEDYQALQDQITRLKGELETAQSQSYSLKKDLEQMRIDGGNNTPDTTLIQ